MTGVNPSEALLVIAIGACAYLGGLQLWLGFRTEGPSRWAAAWALFAVVSAGARLAQLNAQEAETAIIAARVYGACSPMLLWSLCRLVRSASDSKPRRAELGPAAALACACAAVMLFTPWFIRAEVQPSLDLSGDPYLGVPAGPAMPLVGLQIAAALAWCFRLLRRSSELRTLEKRLFATILVVYAAMGVSTIESSLGWISSAGLAEYGGLVVALGAGQLLAIRQRRLEGDLQRQIDERSQTLRESETRYREVIENAPVGFLSVDARGQLEHANAKLLSLLGSTHAEFASSFNVAAEENAQSSGFSAMLERALRTGEVLAAEFEFDSWWGRRLITRTSVAPRRDATGGVVGALAIIEDVTERRAIERRLQHAQRVEAVGQLAAGIAHEINNPMAYVRSNLTVLGEELSALGKEIAARDPQAPELAQIAPLAELLESSLASVQRTVDIVRDLREFSRAGKAEREAIDANALLENAARLVSTRRDGLSEVSLQLEELPLVVAAPGQLRQAFLNLLMNAVQAAGPNGHVRASSAHADGEVLIRIHDDGAIIRSEERSRLFEPFSSSRGGAGEPSLGLYISQQIVREHGGTIEVLSAEEHGTSFIVRLPAAALEDLTVRA